MQRILLREEKIDRGREHFWVVGLENNHRILFIELISMGTVRATLVEPMEVFSFALQKKASFIMLVHNHPSGDLIPSEQDKDITDRLIQVGRIVSTPVLDHLIISEEAFMSFDAVGLMVKLNESLKYVPPYLLEERLEEMRNKILTEERKKQQKILKALQEKGLSDAEITEVMELSMKELKALLS